jgi:hypothetical protein
MSKSIDGLYECTIKNCVGGGSFKVADILYKGMITSGYTKDKIPW